MVKKTSEIRKIEIRKKRCSGERKSEKMRKSEKNEEGKMK